MVPKGPPPKGLEFPKNPVLKPELKGKFHAKGEKELFQPLNELNGVEYGVADWKPHGFQFVGLVQAFRLFQGEFHGVPPEKANGLNEPKPWPNELPRFHDGFEPLKFDQVLGPLQLLKGEFQPNPVELKGVQVGKGPNAVGPFQPVWGKPFQAGVVGEPNPIGQVLPRPEPKPEVKPGPKPVLHVGA